MSPKKTDDRGPVQLVGEVLEPRCQPAVFLWDPQPTLGNNWSTPGNWDIEVVEGALYQRTQLVPAVNRENRDDVDFLGAVPGNPAGD